MKRTNDSGRLRGVSLGPGPPDLITVRALEALKNSDRIYCPAPRSGDRSEGQSRCFSILRHHGFEEKTTPVAVDMNNRSTAEDSYETLRGILLKDLNDGLDVSVVCEGCVSLYSTAFRILCGDVFGGGFELIPGVSSPSAAAAQAGVCLGLGDDTIAVIPGVTPTQEIQLAVDSFQTVVVIKPVRPSALIELIRENNLEFVYCRDLGGKEHFITGSVCDIEAGEVPYFSLFILSGGLRGDRWRAE